MSAKLLMQCSTCLEVKEESAFPTELELTHNHERSTCHECFEHYVNSQIQNTTTDEIRCPECQEQLGIEEVRRFASEVLFARYQNHKIDRLKSQVENFVWCPLGCGTGQRHYLGTAHPLVFCLNCRLHFCSRHMMAWHSQYTCEEYDAFLADPQNFQSQAQIRRAAEEAQELEHQRLQEEIDAAEARFAQHLLREEEAAEARRLEQVQRERRLAEERARRAEEERRAREAALHQARLRDEETATSNVFHRLTKPCPQCRRPTEKNGGCDHMICTADYLISWD
ncbi:hypothetical protein GGR54DRAFT_652652 [Hypoxylon sp. NC1633]|nr:hypothetical protein GGR54DRAFT_652652 [Hypoxylon sp. NC1633]